MNYFCTLHTVILLTSLFALFCDAARSHRKQPPHLRDWSVDNDGVCSGTSSGRALHQGNRLTSLRKQYENCTRIYGNLEITHIRQEVLVGENLETAFSFLDHIQQVTGYVFLYQNEFQSITLKNLQIIWGDILHEDRAALHIVNNAGLKYVNMPKLRSVERGEIVIADNPYLCYMNKTISYAEILGRSHVEKRLLVEQSHQYCHTLQVKCSANCSGHCWGPEEDMCQTIYREFCPPGCTSEMCFTSGNKTGCCDDACAAGCYGEGKSECIACARLEQDSKCVEKCNGLTDYDRTKMMTVSHANPRYTYDRYCVERCPDEALIQEDYCVMKCRPGYYHNTVNDVNDTRKCERCPNDVCPKTCTLKEPINSDNIKTLHNCTVIEGSIQLKKHYFTKHYVFPASNINFEEEAQNVSPPLREGLSLNSLEVLSSVSVVTEYVDIQAAEFSPESLSFLRNLHTIEGRRLAEDHALKIHSNANLRQLGLRSLKKIKNGKVYISHNSNLCYVETMGGGVWDKIIDMRLDNRPVYKITDNKNQSICEMYKRLCHPSCNPEKGCWGAGPEMCIECLKFDMGDRCSTTCPIEDSHYVRNGKECKKCDEQCRRCSGPTAMDCTECRHVSLQQGTSKQCISKCPDTHYQSGTVCIPCSKACYSFGCTGGGDHLGPGGCRKCQYGVRLHDCKNCSDDEGFRCLYGNAKDVCAENNYTNYYVKAATSNQLIEQAECARCSEECATCTGYGHTVYHHQCQCAHFFTHSREGDDRDRFYCSMSCDKGSMYLIAEKTEGKVGECGECHRLCDPTGGCHGKNEDDCERCLFAAEVLDGGRLRCLEVCPKHLPHPGNDNICQLTHPEELRQKKKRVTLVSVAAGVFVFLLIGSILAWNCLKYKRYYRKELQMNLPVLPEVEPIDPNAKPNMARLCLISNEHLSKTSRPLGRGAFGVVYAGYWWPKGKESNDKVMVAIKVVQDPTGTAQQEMLAEAGIMASMRHEYLLRLVGVCLSDGIQLVTPLRPLGALRDFLIKHRQKLGARDLILYCYQIASAMEYLYKNRLVHRDLAARNVLVKRTNHVEVTDFGLAKMLERGKSEVIVGGKVALKWLALESLQYRAYTHWTDVWAFGVTCWEVLTFGQTPYQGISPENIRAHLEDGNRLEQPNNCAQDLYQTLLQCWLPNPESRPSFVILKEKFSQYCRVPNLYVLDRHHPMRVDSLSFADQGELINELMEDDGAQYLEDEPDEETATNTTVPATPVSATFSGKPENSLFGRRARRFVSTDSGRYASEPTPGPRTELGMDEGNYLVPNTKESPALLYTPVVVRENGETELLKTTEYYNDKVGNEYYNEMNAKDNPLKTKEPEMPGLQNDEYFAESETAL